MSEETIYGLHAVRSVMTQRPQAVKRLWLIKRQDERLADLWEQARTHRWVIETRTAQELDAVTQHGVHQGVVAQVTPQGPMAEEDLLMRLGEANHVPWVLVLDGVQDPHNLGACLRTADAVGADAVVVPKDRATGLTPVVRKVAAGAAETIPLVQVTNLARTLRALKEQGLWIVGTDGEAKTPHYQAPLTGPLAIVLGAEGTGMRRLTREHCDVVVQLPLRGTVQSLNVSVAAGVMLYEALRQREQV